MAERDPDVVMAGWNIVLSAGRAKPRELPPLAAQLADILDRDGMAGAPIARLAAYGRMVRNLGLLADAAAPDRGGALHRLWQLAESNRDELDELEWDAEEDEDGFDELPA